MQEQISSEMLEKILDKIYEEGTGVTYARPYVKEQCKKAGYIKESSIELARKFTKDLKEHLSKITCFIALDKLDKVVSFYERAFSEKIAKEIEEEWNKIA
jgi:hypothetical protein